MSNQDETETIVESTTVTDGQPISTVSHKRRVHFPSDESQLRIVSIAPEPLSNQPLLSLGVTLQRYRAACQRLQIRPLNCLLDQLSTIDDTRKSFQDRLDCLRIINERLDLKHIDAIEEIFSRCRFYTLDFDSSFSDDLALVQLFDVIEYYETCTHLNLSNNRSIGVQGYQGLTKYLRKTRYLERLDMNSIRFDDTSMLGFGRSLRLSSTLYELHVESCQLNGKILQKFIQNLRSCVCLRELYLCDNRLQIQDSILINELIRSCGQFLHVLDLRSNSLQDNGLSHIASQLSQYDENHTQQNAIYKLSFQSNQLTHQGIGFLAKSLLHNRTIRSLNLSHNQITNEGFYFLRDALLTNRTINELILRNCRLTDQAAIALAEYIAESSIIQYIDLRENQIQISGICGIAIAMKTNKSLLRFDIDPVLSSSINSNNNIDRTATTTSTPPATQTNSLLSFTNLRRMTLGFGGTTSTANGNNENTRELNEQKSKWLNDIECICQRNWILYEDEQQRKQKELESKTVSVEKPTTNGTEQQEIPSTTLINNDFEEITAEDIPTENQSTTNGTIETQPSVDTNAEIPLSNDETIKVQSSVDTNTEIPLSNDETIEVQSSPDVNTEVILSNEENVETQPSVDEVIKVEEVNVDLAEPLSNGKNHEETLPELADENSISDNSPIIEDEDNDQKHELRHSDSLYLIRKKINNDEENTSDDESEISSTIEPQPIINNA